MSDTQRESFSKGDPVWITDDYAGSPHPAVITSAWDNGHLYAESTRPVAGDSRAVQWSIPPETVADTVKHREPVI
jgi:hypothetical protein